MRAVARRGVLTCPCASVSAAAAVVRGAPVIDQRASHCRRDRRRLGVRSVPLSLLAPVSVAYRFGRFELRTATRELLADRVAVPLGARAFDVLLALVERRERLVPKSELLDVVWPGLVVEENNLQVQISALRKVLGQDAIATIPGLGYRFTAALSERGASGARSEPTPDPLHKNATRATRPSPVDDGAPSIAVLPFVNMSDDEANEYFADGVAEELLNVLSKIRGLRVASHTSAFTFKGTKVDIATIATRLNVSTVLEGSVRKSGKRVRITVQLVHVATDSHLWSDTYDREVDDIFAVQDDIARAVVRELRSTLLGESRGDPANAAVRAEVRAAAKGRSKNPEAYRLYLQGRALVVRRTQASVSTGIEYLRKAVTLDPDFAVAWAALSYAQMIEAGTGGWAPFGEGYERARKSAERALALEPDLAEGHAALAHVRQGHDWDWAGAQASMRRALELAPGNAEVVLAAAVVAGDLADLEESIALCRRAIALDPLNPTGHRYLGMYCRLAGRLDEAEPAIKEALALNPYGGLICAALGDVHLAQHRFHDALAAFEKESHEGFRLLGLAMAHHALGQKRSSIAALEQLGELPMHAYLNSKANAFCGNLDAAFEWLERAYDQRNAGLSQARVDAYLQRLHDDPRWPPFLAKLGFSPSQ